MASPMNSTNDELQSTAGFGSANSEARHNINFSLSQPAVVESFFSRGCIIGGRYKILEHIGEGGMGTVFVAEQAEPVARSVALKIIKYGLTSQTAQIRFQQERQVLALMNHSNIAKVYDGGVTETGNPYFAMELVKGTTVSKYCNDKKLNIQERMHLFISICNAVQHAHQKGIIHRDIKPTNIMVTEENNTAVVKVIDFGVAKAVQGPLVEGTIFTEKGSLVGTLEYMAPEQAGTDQFDIDTRADIYSLGVILYEMLTGTLPFNKYELRQTSLDEAIRMIRKVDPPRPSTRLTLLSKNADKISSVLPGITVKELRKTCNDLDWVVMKCLEKDRNNRYEHVSDLLADINRFLEHRPVSARTPSIVYQMRKFVKRNRGLVTASAAIVVALIAGAIMMTFGLTHALAAQAQARSENEINKSLLGFINEDLFSAIDMEERHSLGIEMDKDLKIRTLLDRSTKEIDNGRFATKPLVEAALRLTIGKAYNALGMPQVSEMHLKKSLDLRCQHLQSDHTDIANSLDALGGSYMLQGRYAQAVQMYENALQRWVTLHGKDSKEANNTKLQISSACLWAGKLAEAHTVNQELLNSLNLTCKSDDREMLDARNLQALILQKQKKFQESEEVFRNLQQSTKNRYGVVSPYYLKLLNNYAQVVREQQKYQEAIAIYHQMIPIAEKTHESDSVMTALYRNNYSTLLIRGKDYVNANLQLSMALPVFEKCLGRDHEKTAIMRSNYAFLKSKMGNHQQSIVDYQGLKQVYLNNFGYQSQLTENLFADMINVQLVLKDIVGALDAMQHYLTCLKTQHKIEPDTRAKRIITQVAQLAKDMHQTESLIKNYETLASNFPVTSALHQYIVAQTK